MTIIISIKTLKGEAIKKTLSQYKLQLELMDYNLNRLCTCKSSILDTSSDYYNKQKWQ